MEQVGGVTGKKQSVKSLTYHLLYEWVGSVSFLAVLYEWVGSVLFLAVLYEWVWSVLFPAVFQVCREP